MSEQQYILVINLGSSSGKFAIFPLAENAVAQEPTKIVSLKLDPRGGTDLKSTVAQALQSLLGTIGTLGAPECIAAVGHRVVHGGNQYKASVLVTPAVENNIELLEEFAPIHNRLNLIGMQAAKLVVQPQIKQVAVFDTAYHRTIKEVASRYPVPYDWQERFGIRRYGFHGISTAYAVERASQMLNIDRRNFTGIICHLGSGCSISAIDNGESVDTSMGFTPLEGLMMGTRCGSIDPGILLELLGNSKLAVQELTDDLNYCSGLSGVSGLGNDMVLILEEAKRGNQRAKLALDMFVYRAQSFIGSYFVHLHKPRAIVFTGGIGENSAIVREMIVGGLNGIECALDRDSNETSLDDAEISAPTAAIKILLVKAREDFYIARETAAFVG